MTTNPSSGLASKPGGSSDSEHPEAGAPWWRYGVVWMVWGGPAIVVVASFITLGFALMIPDPVVTQDQVSVSRTAAHQARNHAATGTAPAPKPTGR